MIREPRILLLGLILIPMAWIAFRRYRRSLPGVLSIAGGTARDVNNLYLIRWFFGNLSYFLAILLLLVALAGVRWGRTPPPEVPADVDVVFAFDVSRSMLAEDVTPNRLDRSVAVARSIADDHAEIAFGIVVFKGQGLIFLPLTRDITAIDSHLDLVDIDIVTTPGTDIESGLRASARAFPEGRNARSVVILFTDGGFLEGNPGRVEDVFSEEDIGLVVVGAGGADPVPIPLGSGYVLDETGSRVLTSVRSDVLAMLSPDDEPLMLSDADVVDTIGEEILGTRRPRSGIPKDRYRLLLVSSLLFIIVWIALRTVPWRDLF